MRDSGRIQANFLFWPMSLFWPPNLYHFPPVPINCLSEPCSDNIVRSQDFTFNNSHLVRAYLKYWSRPALTYLKVNVDAIRYHNETKNAFVPMYWIYTNLCLQTGGSGDYFTRSINVKGTPFMGTNEKRRLTQGGFNQSAILCSHCSSRNWIPNIAKTLVTHWFQKEDLVQL